MLEAADELDEEDDAPEEEEMGEAEELDPDVDLPELEEETPDAENPAVEEIPSPLSLESEDGGLDEASAIPQEAKTITAEIEKNNRAFLFFIFRLSPLSQQKVRIHLTK